MKLLLLKFVKIALINIEEIKFPSSHKEATSTSSKGTYPLAPPSRHHGIEMVIRQVKC